VTRRELLYSAAGALRLPNRSRTFFAPGLIRGVSCISWTKVILYSSDGLHGNLSTEKKIKKEKKQSKKQEASNKQQDEDENKMMKRSTSVIVITTTINLLQVVVKNHTCNTSNTQEII